MEQNLERQKVNSPHLKNIRPDTGSFREHFRRNAGKLLSIFKNLGGDSILIAPNPPFKNDDFDFNSNRLYRDWTINRWFITRTPWRNSESRQNPDFISMSGPKFLINRELVKLRDHKVRWK